MIRDIAQTGERGHQALAEYRGWLKAKVHSFMVRAANAREKKDWDKAQYFRGVAQGFQYALNKLDGKVDDVL